MDEKIGGAASMLPVTSCKQKTNKTDFEECSIIEEIGVQACAPF